MSAVLISLILAATTPKVIVLPFENRSGDAQLEPLRQGLADLVLTDLVGVTGLTVLERARLTEVMKELQLQQTRAFDPTQTAKLGKLLGATHAIAGSLVAISPKVRLVVRVIALPRGELLTTAQVEGDGADLFALESELMKRLITALQLTLDAPRGQHASLQALTAWSQGVSAREAGDLDAAKSKLAEAVRLSPGFDIAESDYLAVMQRLRDAQEKRGSLLDERSTALHARLETLLTSTDPHQRLAARIGLANLALITLSRKANARAGHATFSPQTTLSDDEKAFIEHATQVIEALRTTTEPKLDEQTRALSQEATGLDVSTWDFATPASVSIDIARYLGSGWSPYRSDVPEFALRPAPSQRSPKYFDEAKRWFDRAAVEVAKVHDREALAFSLANERAEMLVLHGRKVEAVAQWQGFLDAFPAAENFKAATTKLETVMGLDDESEADALAVKSCDAPALVTRGSALATRWWRSKGVTGLEALAMTLSKCGQKRIGFTLAANELVRIGDCESFTRLKTKAVEQGVPLGTCAP